MDKQFTNHKHRLLVFASSEQSPVQSARAHLNQTEQAYPISFVAYSLQIMLTSSFTSLSSSAYWINKDESEKYSVNSCCTQFFALPLQIFPFIVLISLFLFFLPLLLSNLFSFLVSSFSYSFLFPFSAGFSSMIIFTGVLVICNEDSFLNCFLSFILALCRPLRGISVYGSAWDGPGVGFRFSTALTSSFL